MTFEHLPKYKCHKVVRALKIKAMIGKGNLNSKHISTVIIPEDENYSRFEVIDYADKVKGDGKDLGYFVQYEDGYISWSPTKAFEDGYTKIEECSEDINTVMESKANSKADEAIKRDFRDIINKHSRENLSNTPDFLLAEFLLNCLKNYEMTAKAKEANRLNEDPFNRVFGLKGYQPETKLKTEPPAGGSGLSERRMIKVALINGNMPDKNGRKYDLTKIDLTTLPKNVRRVEIKDNVLFGEIDVSEKEYNKLIGNFNSVSG